MKYFDVPSLPLYRSGFHYIDLGSVDIETPKVEIDTDSVGSMGSVAEWRVGFFDGQDWIYLEEKEGVFQWDRALSHQSSLVITLWSSLEKEGETFSYRYRVYSDESSAEALEKNRLGCISSSSSNQNSQLVIFSVLGFFIRRRGLL